MATEVRVANGRASNVLVLCYHAVDPGWSSTLAIAPSTFAAQVTSLLERGFAAVTFTRAVLDPPPGKVVAITFDDAYRSVGIWARPVLRELGVPATVFAPTGLVGRERPMRWAGIERWAHGPTQSGLLPLSWEMLTELAEEGWEIGSHTRTHRALPRLSGRELDEELRASREDCEGRLGIPCLSVAYPYGAVDSRVARAARRAGYVAGAALSRTHPQGLSRLRWPRIGVYPVDGPLRFALKVNSASRAFRTTRAWSAFVTADAALRRRRAEA